MISSQSDDPTIKTAADYPMRDIAGIGCFQFFPIFFFFLMFIALFFMTMFDDEQVDVSNFDSHSLVLVTYLSVSSIGLGIGIISSLYLFSAKNKKNIKSLKRGILLNIITWIAFSISLVFLNILLNLSQGL